MIQAGQVVLALFPFSDLTQAKKRPVLLIKPLGSHKDWLVCMVSSRLHQGEAGLDMVMDSENPEFKQTGLKVSSLFRLSRLAILDEEILLGPLGAIQDETLVLLKQRLSSWLLQ